MTRLLAAAFLALQLVPARAMRELAVKLEASTQDEPGSAQHMLENLGKGIFEKFGTYSCQVVSGNETLDRWVSVQPQQELSTKALKLFSFAEWKAHLESAMGVEPAEAAGINFDPVVLRGPAEYGDRILVKTMSTSSAGETCIDTVKVACSEGKLTLVTASRCSGSPEDAEEQTRAEALGLLGQGLTFCSHGPKRTLGFFGAAWSKDVVVLDEAGQGQVLPAEECATISVLDPNNGIDLGDLNSDMMGLGQGQFHGSANVTKAMMAKLNATLWGVYAGALEKGQAASEASEDALRVVQALAEDASSGGEAAAEKSLKWLKKMALASMVETCLCCDKPAMGTGELLSDHCKVAYTLGGENRSETLQYAVKTMAGTMYNLAQTAGGWLVPFVGGNIVQHAHKSACSFTCGLRKPHLYEPYRFGKVRKVPGMAFQTWFVPNPNAFLASAAGAEGLPA